MTVHDSTNSQPEGDDGAAEDTSRSTLEINNKLKVKFKISNCEI
jgi:hypothetical protein